MFDLELYLELFFMLPFIVVALFGIGSVKRDRPVIMTRRSVRARITRLWRLFYDPAWVLRIGRSVWCGPRIGRFSVAYSKGAGLVLCWWSAPCMGFTNLDNRRGPLALSRDHGSRTLERYILRQGGRWFTRLSPWRDPIGISGKFPRAEDRGSGITVEEIDRDLEDFKF